MSETYYTPGVCNINKAEVRHRKQAYYIGAAAAASLLGILYILDVSAVVGIIVFAPAWFAALGYLQAKHSFCVGYAKLGKYSSGDGIAQTTSVDKRRSHLADTFRAKQINNRALIYGAASAAVAILFLRIT